MRDFIGDNSWIIPVSIFSAGFLFAFLAAVIGCIPSVVEAVGVSASAAVGIIIYLVNRG
jgi:hypothetical protein